MAPRPLVDTDRKLADRNLVVALLRSFGRKRENRLEEARGSLTPKRDRKIPPTRNSREGK
jgi:hypothetical protein